MPRRQPIFLFGLACLLGATILISFGRHIALLVIARFLQGLAAAITWTSGLALLMDIFGKERYGEAMGYGQTSVSIGTILAPLLGGTVYAKGGFSAVSGMSIGVVGLAFTLGCVMIEPKAADRVPEIAVNGNSEHSNNSSHQTMSREEQSIRSSSFSNGSAVGEQPQPDEETALLGVNLHKKRTSKPAYHILLRNGRILAAMCGIFTYAFVIISFEGLIPLFVKETFHWDSTHTALIFLSWIIPGLLAPIAGMASDRLGSRWVASGGFLVAVAPLILMRLVTHDSTGQKALLSSLLTLVGESAFSRFPFLPTERSQMHQQRHHCFLPFSSSLIRIPKPTLCIPPRPAHRAHKCQTISAPQSPHSNNENSGLGLAWVMPSCTSDLTSAAAALKQQHPSSFGDSGNASTQAFGLFVFAYSCGTCVGPTVAGIIKAKLSWGAATAILAAACAGATVPIVSSFFLLPSLPLFLLPWCQTNTRMDQGTNGAETKRSVDDDRDG